MRIGRMFFELRVVVVKAEFVGRERRFFLYGAGEPLGERFDGIALSFRQAFGPGTGVEGDRATVGFIWDAFGLWKNEKTVALEGIGKA